MQVLDTALIPNQRVDMDYGSMTVKRLDLLHPEISGNKWFKLKYNIEKTLQSEHKTLLTFGGAWSNHIHATAQAGKLFGIKTIGVIRGEESPILSQTLRDAKECGMELQFVSRLDYAEKNTDDFKEWLHSKHGNFHLVPEGGSNFLGVNGCLEILTEGDNEYDYVCCDCGTGATLAGIILSAMPHQKILGFSVLKNGDFLKDDILGHIRNFLMNDEAAEEYENRFEILTEYDFGGFAKWNEVLLSFISDFEEKYQIPTDQVYTGKLFYGVMDLFKKNFFSKNDRVLVIHTGGLQGRNSLRIHQTTTSPILFAD